jgi:hypothetical protein
VKPRSLPIALVWFFLLSGGFFALFIQEFVGEYYPGQNYSDFRWEVRDDGTYHLYFSLFEYKEMTFHYELASDVLYYGYREPYERMPFSHGNPELCGNGYRNWIIASPNDHYRVEIYVYEEENWRYLSEAASADMISPPHYDNLCIYEQDNPAPITVFSRYSYPPEPAPLKLSGLCLLTLGTGIIAGHVWFLLPTIQKIPQQNLRRSLTWSVILYVLLGYLLVYYLRYF